jgi:hypothetical protein
MLKDSEIQVVLSKISTIFRISDSASNMLAGKFVRISRPPHCSIDDATGFGSLRGRLPHHFLDPL